MFASDITKLTSQHEPAGESPGRLVDVLIRTMNETYGEIFHERSNKVVIWKSLAIGVSVKPDEDGGIVRYAFEKGFE